MRFESVRLLHAQGVPNQYIVNQVYQPVDEEHRERGSFLILLEHHHTTNGTFAASLVTSLVREYYRHHTADRLGCFERTLVHLNELIRHYASSHETQQPFILRGTIVLFVNDEVHMSHIGRPRAYLQRDQHIIQLIESDPDDSTEAFSVITSGEVYPNDILTLVTSPDGNHASKEELLFALNHTPLFEAGRAYAQLLKQKYEKATEALFIRFNDDPSPEGEMTYQIYIDRALETSKEKFETYQKILTRQLSFMAHGVRFFISLAGRRKARRSKPLKTSQPPEPLEPPEEASTSPPLGDEREIEVIEEPDQAREFEVRTYNRGKPHVSLPPPIQTYTNPVRRPAHRSIFKSRTMYLLVGSLIFLFIFIRVVNSLSNKHQRTTHVDVKSLVTQAGIEQRDATAAQSKKDNEAAITHLLRAVQLIKQIPSDSQTEESKVMDRRIGATLDSLTDTTLLTQAASVLLPSAPLKVVGVKDDAYIVYPTDLMQHYSGAALSAISSLPLHIRFTDAVQYENGTKIALLGQDATTKVLALDIKDKTIKELARADKKEWPDAKQLASYDVNLYFVGPSMWKAAPKDDTTYRVSAFATSVSTTSVQTVTNQASFFWAIENGNQLIRLANNSPKTAVKLYGVPAEFLPKQVTRILASPQETLYFFDREGQRLLEFTTDGAYRKQYVLPAESNAVDCDAAAKGFVCVSNKQLQTFIVK